MPAPEAPRVASCLRCGRDVPLLSPHPGEYKVVCPSCGASGIVRVRAHGQERSPGHETRFFKVARLRKIGTYEQIYQRFDDISTHVLPGKWGLLAVYAFLTVLSEVVTVLASPVAGVVLHGLVLLILLFHAAALSLHSEPISRFIVALALLPLIRIVSLTTPIGTFSYFQWFILTGAVILAAGFGTMRALGHAPWELGLHAPTPRQYGGIVLLGLAGVGIGALEYAILKPAPLLPDVGLGALVGPALLIIILSGLSEEVVFRGLLQRTAAPVFGPTMAVILPAAGQALLDIAFFSPAHTAVVFASGLLFGWAMRRSGHLAGVAVAHGLANVMLFLVLPLTGLPLGM